MAVKGTTKKEETLQNEAETRAEDMTPEMDEQYHQEISRQSGTTKEKDENSNWYTNEDIKETGLEEE